ncbi:hypothetical protein MTR67_003625 [Solanum verrucosum]|uniref:Uncharacterized protein n=1 Tax=Solanum verrucosum TaxID=315347 RepID=A0AAF0TE99_SOLVR|nr:hypothetical protein MTR67_003625 [Solanum verrucosum]
MMRVRLGTNNGSRVPATPRV